MNPNLLSPLVLDRSRNSSLQQQLYEKIKAKIHQSRLTPGQLLPASRELARELQISRNTVLQVYDRLIGEGLLETKPRLGVQVSEDLVQDHTAPSVLRPKASVAKLTQKDQEPCLRGPMPFHPSQPDVRLFPIDKWNRCRTRAIRKLGPGLLDYQSRFALGLPSLRYQVAEYLNASRGVHCNWQQVVITSGSQNALFMLSNVLLRPKDQVLFEDPGYLGARRAFEYCAAKLVTMKLDHFGSVPPVRATNAKLLYVTPSRHYPTGVTMPASRREQVLAYASHTKTLVIEDDYDSEFRYSRPPLPSLHSLDTRGNVIYLGSMSKVLFPSLRIGYMVVPESLLEPLEQFRLTMDDHGPLVDQATLADFLESGLFYRHVRRCRRVYGRRLEAFLTHCDRRKLPLRFPFIDGGMNQTGFFEDERIDDRRASQRLTEMGLRVPPLSNFCLKKYVPGLVFGFTAFDESQIADSVDKVAKSLRAF